MKKIAFQIKNVCFGVIVLPEKLSNITDKHMFYMDSNNLFMYSERKEIGPVSSSRSSMDFFAVPSSENGKCLLQRAWLKKLAFKIFNLKL